MDKLIALAAVALALLVASTLTIAKDDGAPSGNTGAPAVGGRDCTSCHSGTTNSGPGSVVLTAPSVYAPGSVVPISVALTNMQNASANGFQLAAYDKSNNLVSGLIPTDSNCFVRSNHANHTKSGLRQSSWFLYMTTPSTPTNFALYVAGLDADGRGNKDGDRTYTTSQAMTPGVVNLSMMAWPRVGATLPLALEAPGEANNYYVMAASLGNTGIPIGARTLPLSADGLFFLTATNQVPSVFVNFQGNLDANAKASASLVVPSISGLAGVTIHMAYVVVNASAPGGIGTISNGLAARLF